METKVVAGTSLDRECRTRDLHARGQRLNAAMKRAAAPRDVTQDRAHVRFSSFDERRAHTLELGQLQKTLHCHDGSWMVVSVDGSYLSVQGITFHSALNSPSAFLSSAAY